jgi:hypothetical protein
VSRLIQAPEHTEIPHAVLAAPAPIKDSQYATLIATAFAYATLSRGEQPTVWMTEAKPLTTEWLWGGEGRLRRSETTSVATLLRRSAPRTYSRESATGSPIERRLREVNGEEVADLLGKLLDRLAARGVVVDVRGKAESPGFLRDRSLHPTRSRHQNRKGQCDRGHWGDGIVASMVGALRELSMIGIRGSVPDLKLCRAQGR